MISLLVSQCIRSWISVFVALATTAGCSGPTSVRSVPPGPPDLVVLLADGLRDGAGALGTAAAAYREELGLDGRHRYTAAYTQSIEPHVALGALFSARFPSAIPLCGRPHLAGAAEPWCFALPDQVPTLAGVLGVYGYASAFVATEALGHVSMARGFGTVLAPVADPAVEARAWWAAHADAPRLLVVDTPLDLESLRPLVGHTDEGAYALAWAREREDPLPDTDPSRYKADYGGATDAWGTVDEAYDALAAAAGGAARALLDGLPTSPDRGRWVVTTSLYGVSLGEFAGTDHPEQLVPGRAELLLERTAHVPLDLYDPDGTVANDDQPAQLVDIADTLFALAGAVAPAETNGRDLRAAPTTPPTAYAEFGDMLLLRRGPDLLTFRAERHGSSSLSPALTQALLDPTRAEHPGVFRISRVTEDPLQTGDRTNDPATTDLRAALVAVRTGPAAPPPDALTPDRVRQLQEMGARGYW